MSCLLGGPLVHPGGCAVRVLCVPHPSCWLAAEARSAAHHAFGPQCALHQVCYGYCSDEGGLFGTNREPGAQQVQAHCVTRQQRSWGTWSVHGCWDSSQGRCAVNSNCRCRRQAGCALQAWHAGERCSTAVEQSPLTMRAFVPLSSVAPCCRTPCCGPICNMQARAASALADVARGRRLDCRAAASSRSARKGPTHHGRHDAKIIRLPQRCCQKARE